MSPFNLLPIPHQGRTPLAGSCTVVCHPRILRMHPCVLKLCVCARACVCVCPRMRASMYPWTCMQIIPPSFTPCLKLERTVFFKKIDSSSKFTVTFTNTICRLHKTKKRSLDFKVSTVTLDTHTGTRYARGWTRWLKIHDKPSTRTRTFQAA